METEIITLLEVNDMIVAEDIQGLLEESQIYSVLVSDNPASSALKAYSGYNPPENVSIQINKDDYQEAIAIINISVYKDLLTTA